MNNKEKTYIALAIVALLIVYFLMKNKQKVLTYFNDEKLQIPELKNYDINLGDIAIPDLSFFQGVTSCGCGTHVDAPSMPIGILQNIAPDDAIIPIAYQTPRPLPRSFANVVMTPSPSRSLWP